MTAAPPFVTLAHRVRPCDAVMAQRVGDEIVLLDLASEYYFGLDPIGARIWEAIPGAASLSDVHMALCEEFDAEPARIETDLLALVGQLRDAGLVELE